jgi:Ala-tRNA(Pro) deacylase
MREAVYTFLEAQNIPYRLQEHEAVFTVAESSVKLPEKVPVKTLLVTDEKKQQVWMVAMRGLNRLDMKRLAHAVGAKKLQFVNPERVEDIVGVLPGSVSIFGLLHPGAKNVQVIFDESLLTEPELGFHPNDNTATVFLNPEDVLKIIRETNHDCRILAL